MIFQAGDSEQGRDFAASAADAIFSRHSTLGPGKRFTPTSRADWPDTGAVVTSCSSCRPRHS